MSVGTCDSECVTQGTRTVLYKRSKRVVLTEVHELSILYPHQFTPAQNHALYYRL